MSLWPGEGYTDYEFTIELTISHVSALNGFNSTRAVNKILFLTG